VQEYLRAHSNVSERSVGHALGMSATTAVLFSDIGSSAQRVNGHIFW
jgi:hypothetical protein